MLAKFWLENLDETGHGTRTSEWIVNKQRAGARSWNEDWTQFHCIRSRGGLQYHHRRRRPRHRRRLHPALVRP